MNVGTLEDIDVKIQKLKEEIDEKLQLVNANLSEIGKSFSLTLNEYNRLMAQSRKLFDEALAQKDFISFVVKGIGAGFNYLVAKYKKWRWHSKFSSDLKNLKMQRAKIISNKLKDLEELESKFIPYIRENIETLLFQLGKFNKEFVISNSMETQINKRIDALLSNYYKTYFLEGALLYLKQALQDALAGRAIVGNVSIWEKRLEEAVVELKRFIKTIPNIEQSYLYHYLN